MQLFQDAHLHHLEEERRTEAGNCEAWGAGGHLVDAHLVESFGEDPFELEEQVDEIFGNFWVGLHDSQ